MKIAAVGDIHVRTDTTIGTLFADVSKDADILLLCGDLTDNGLPEEAHLLASEARSCTIPIIAVLGNHDYEACQEDKITSILKESGMNVLRGDNVVIKDIGFAGTKGFGGGFDRFVLPNWGEKVLKQMVQEGLNEGLLLENALNKLTTEKKIVLLHYSPIRATVEGESLEIYPFLGLSRLCEPINRYDVSLVVHGHAHHGTHEGKTEKGIPVYNVAQKLLEQTERSYAIIDI